MWNIKRIKFYDVNKIIYKLTFQKSFSNFEDDFCLYYDKNLRLLVYNTFLFQLEICKFYNHHELCSYCVVRARTVKTENENRISAQK